MDSELHKENIKRIFDALDVGLDGLQPVGLETTRQVHYGPPSIEQIDPNTFNRGTVVIDGERYLISVFRPLNLYGGEVNDDTAPEVTSMPPLEGTLWVGNLDSGPKNMSKYGERRRAELQSQLIRCYGLGRWEESWVAGSSETIEYRYIPDKKKESSIGAITSSGA